jgi:hypothetical protein
MGHEELRIPANWQEAREISIENCIWSRVPKVLNLVVAWPTNSGTLTLQSSTNLIEWLPAAPTSIVNGHYMVTNMTSGAHQFFRLSR